MSIFPVCLVFDGYQNAIFECTYIYRYQSGQETSDQGMMLNFRPDGFCSWGSLAVRGVYLPSACRYAYQQRNHLLTFYCTIQAYCLEPVDRVITFGPEMAPIIVHSDSYPDIGIWSSYSAFVFRLQFYAKSCKIYRNYQGELLMDFLGRRQSGESRVTNHHLSVEVLP